MRGDFFNIISRDCKLLTQEIETTQSSVYGVCLNTQLIYGFITND